MKLTAVYTGQCEMSARLFILSCKKGYDSRDFIDKLLSSDLAVHMYHDEISSIWLGEKYLMETLEEEVKIKKGEVLSADFMEWAGYLYGVLIIRRRCRKICWNRDHVKCCSKCISGHM